MTTIEDFTAGDQPMLRLLPLGATGSPVTVIDELVLLEEQQNRKAATLQGALVIASLDGREPGQIALCFAQLAQQGAAGVIVVGRLPSPARTFPLPVYAPTEEISDQEALRSRLQRRQLHILQRRFAAEQHRAALMADLFNRADRLRRDGQEPDELLPWLNSSMNADVALVSGTPGAAWERVPVPRKVLEQVASTPHNSDGWEEPGLDGHRSLLHAVGVIFPHQILIASRRRRYGQWTPVQKELLAKAAVAMRLLNTANAQHLRSQDLERVEAVGRALALQQIMRGDIPAARRTLPELLPDLLTTEWTQVGVLRCAPGEDRTPIREAVDRALAGRALVALCPAEKTDLLVLYPRAEPGSDSDVNKVDLTGALRAIVDENPARLLGISQPAPWTQAIFGYVMAVQLLGRAALHGDNIAAYADAAYAEPMVMGIPVWARDWARTVLAKLDRLPAGDRHELMQTALLAVTLGPVQASRLLGADDSEMGDHPHRITVAYRLGRLERLLGLGNDVADRAVLYTALQLAALEGTGDESTAGLREALASKQAETHAVRLLRPLTRDQLRLLEDCFTLGRIETAKVWNRSPKTITNRRDEIAALIGRSLSAKGPPWGAYDVLLALISHPDTALTADVLPDPALDLVAAAA
jgi:hypothetical protein